MTVSSILNEARMSNRSSYYSGRGATMSDLNGQILEKIYSLILQYYGKDAATSFVDMVEDMPNMNATDFIDNLYRLERNGFTWQKSTASTNGVSIDKDKNGEHNMAQGIATIFEMMSGSMNRDQTPQIKNGFLRSHGRRVSIGNRLEHDGRFYEIYDGY